MIILRTPSVLSVLSLLSFLGTLSVAACGSSNTTAGGTGGMAGSGAGVLMMCGGGSVSTNTCTTAETNTYNNCVQTACNDTYTTCLGAGYRSGTFGGTCGATFKCTSACACTNFTCLAACAPSLDCVACLEEFSTCSATCTEPACYSSGAGTGGSTGSATGGATGAATGGSTGTGTSCADLIACCNASDIPQLKASCMMSVMGADDAACATALAQVRALVCP
jgi:hypothetical protein